jgi:uncharacterized protein
LKLTRQSPSDRQIIQRYGNGGFRISGTAFQGSVIITPAGVASWTVASMSALSLADFQPLIAIADTLDVCLLGCGDQMMPLARDLRAALKEAGLTIDPMDTGAACRTYNVLTGDGRAVATALIAI